MESDSIKVIVENKIPFFKGLLDDVAEVSYLSPEEITAEAVKDTDAIVTRTRTRCDKNLLEGSRCSLIASATIGLDHVDVEWCEQNGIEVKNAPGCNAPAVAQYVFASLLSMGVELEGKCLGIIGAGNVGKIVADWGKQLGMKVIINDPPRELVEGKGEFVSLDTIAAEADVITFHTPYTRNGVFATRHLLDSQLVDKFRRKPVVINSARGAVTDTKALVKGMADGKISHLIIDCWEGEPEISRQLLEMASVATPHIAGYSLQGKQRASYTAAHEVADKFSLRMKSVPEMQYLPEKVTEEDIKKSYNPIDDTVSLKNAPEMFESLRNNYKLRNEVLFPEQ
ncbi:MAG: 4-phosphoerythronate dehydrogenase [Barnesiella sp.]|nr:4-phosphoerythronate dehydrogenase [Barnesiella sp.]